MITPTPINEPNPVHGASPRTTKAARRVCLVSERTRRLVERSDARIGKTVGYASADLAYNLSVLNKTGSVEVGWRACCGCRDVTAKIYAEWIKVVKSLRRDGNTITVEPVKHKNAWATKAGGFWNSEIFTLTATR